MVVDVPVYPSGVGKRLDVYLSQRLVRFTRARIQRMIKRSKVLVDGTVVTRPSYRLRRGQKITLYRLAPQEEGEVTDIPVLYEHAGVLVLSKPGGVTVHPTASVLRQTVTWFLNHRPGPAYAPAHRLDRETSGTLVCAEKGVASAKLKTAFAGRDVHKVYLALVRGRLQEVLHIDAPLALASDSEIMVRMAVTADGAPSSTWIYPLAWGPETTLVACRLDTGRQHQIRVHLEHAGHPIWGDKIYGQPDDVFLEFVRQGMTDDLRRCLSFDRHMLHACAISFVHPETHERVLVRAPVPLDFMDAARTLGVMLTSDDPGLPAELEDWLAGANLSQ